MVETAEKTIQNTQTKNTGSFYDLYIILSPTIIDENISTLENTIKTIIEKNEGKIEKTNKFIKKELIHAVQGSRSAYSSSVYFWMEPEKIENVQNEIKELEQDILRFMLIKTTPEIFKTKTITRAVVDKIERESEERIRGKVGSVSEPTKISTEKSVETKDRVTLDDIDKQLDEIMDTL